MSDSDELRVAGEVTPDIFLYLHNFVSPININETFVEYYALRDMVKQNDEDIRILINESMAIRNKVDEISYTIDIVVNEGIYFRDFMNQTMQRNQELPAPVIMRPVISESYIENIKHRFEKLFYLYGLGLIFLSISHLIHIIGAHS